MKGKRYFTNEEIEKWNKIIEKGYHKYKLGVHDRTKGLYVYESPSRGSDRFLIGSPEQRKGLKDLVDYDKYSPFKFNFSFSVIKKRKSEFFEILDKFIECDIETGERTPIVDLKKESYKFRQTEHKIGNNDLVRIQYNFESLLPAMFVTTLIEDTISFFELMWGYTEDGEEECLLKYPIGSVVSIKDQKGIDYMINSYEYIRPNTLVTSSLGNIVKSTILYDLVCIESGLSSGIVRYGSSRIAQESDIIPSRTNNLNIILN